MKRQSIANLHAIQHHSSHSVDVKVSELLAPAKPFASNADFQVALHLSPINRHLHAARCGCGCALSVSRPLSFILSAGADANPYLAFAGLLGSGLAGIQQQLSPPPMLEGDGSVLLALLSWCRFSKLCHCCVYTFPPILFEIAGTALQMLWQCPGPWLKPQKCLAVASLSRIRLDQRYRPLYGCISSCVICSPIRLQCL